MSKSSDAERLLNTIVAARVRLSSLRSGPEIPSDVRAKSFDSSSEPDADAPIRNLSSESTSVTLSQDQETGQETDQEAFPNPDPQQDTEPSLILGIDPEVMESRSTMEVMPENEPEATEPDIVTQHEPSIPLDGKDEDPFSFIDLIPPEEPFDAEPTLQNKGEQPSLEPPPVRPKPTMPLPLGMAIGAPPRNGNTDAKAVTQSPTTEALRPSPRHDDLLQSTQDIEVISAQLSQPRAVAPRVLDPDRPGLVVDVFENELGETPHPYPAATPPKLTDGLAIKSPRTRNTDVVRSEDDLFDVITEASAHLDHGDIQTAHMLFSDVLDWLPSHLEARLARGRCSRDMGDTVAAYSDFQRAHVHNPHAPGPHLELGDLFFAKKDYLRAISHYDNALSIDPHHAITLCRRGICHHHQNRADKAIDDLVLARRINPEIPNIERYIRMVTP